MGETKAVMLSLTVVSVVKLYDGPFLSMAKALLEAKCVLFIC